VQVLVYASAKLLSGDGARRDGGPDSGEDVALFQPVGDQFEFFLSATLVELDDLNQDEFEIEEQAPEFGVRAHSGVDHEPGRDEKFTSLVGEPLIIGGIDPEPSEQGLGPRQVLRR
jgi:hypothetical protein